MAIILLESYDLVGPEPKSKNGPDQGTKVKAIWRKVSAGVFSKRDYLRNLRRMRYIYI